MSILGTDQRRRMLMDWNDTQAPYPSDQTIPELLRPKWRGRPTRWRWSSASNNLIMPDSMRGPTSWHIISVRSASAPNPGWVSAWNVRRKWWSLYSAPQGRRCLRTPRPNLSGQRLAFMVDDSRMSVLLTRQSASGHLVKFQENTVCLDQAADQIARQPSDDPPCLTNAGNLAYLMYTSGSTGRPKAIAVEHRAIRD